MNNNNKSKEELLQELHEMKQEFESLKLSYKNDINQLKKAEEKLRGK